MKRPGTAIIFFALLVQGAFAQGTTLWDESVNGPLSESSGSATSLAPFRLGTNTVIGMTEIEPNGASWAVHPDFFTVQVPSGLTVSAVYIQVDKPNVWNWIGDTAFLNELRFVQNPVPGNLLPQWGLSSIGTGAYGLDIENHDAQSVASIASYRLDFFVQAVPEPGAVSLLLVGAGVVGFLRWKKFGRISTAR